MGKKQEELEAKVLQGSCVLLAITESWDESHDRSGAIDSYSCSEDTGQEGEAGGLTSLYIKRWIECGEPSLKNRHKKVKSLWIGIRDWGNRGKWVVGVYNRLPDHQKGSTLLRLGFIKEHGIPQNEDWSFWKTTSVLVSWIDHRCRLTWRKKQAICWFFQRQR